MKPQYEIGTILRKHQHFINNYRFNSWQKRTLFALSKCRTSALGGHIDRCNHKECGQLHLSYNSCRNRHCTKCQGHKTMQWIQKRTQDLLPVGYFHVVFTIPCALNKLALYKPELIYNTLFKTAWATIKGFGDNPSNLGAKTAMIAVLHTWGQNISLHPHLHCIVPAGGITKKGKWKSTSLKQDFLFDVKQMSIVFRAKFVAQLRKNGINDKSLFDKLFKHKWVVYAKKPFANPTVVVEYLGRYTHKIAISNHRIISADNNKVVFKAKLYKDNGRTTNIALTTKEFIRRFSLHILPKGFVRIRHFGFLSSTGKRLYLKNLQKRLGAIKLYKKPIENKHLQCPTCKKGRLVTIYQFTKRGPPKYWANRFKKTEILKTAQ